MCNTNSNEHEGTDSNTIIVGELLSHLPQWINQSDGELINTGLELYFWPNGSNRHTENFPSTATEYKFFSLMYMECIL